MIRRRDLLASGGSLLAGAALGVLVPKSAGCVFIPMANRLVSSESGARMMSFG